MAENQFVSTVEALFKGMDQFVTTKTVVGDAVKVDDAIILPLVDVTCGMAAGSFADNAKHNGGGGMSAKMSPSAVLVIQNGVTKLVNIKQQDAVTKVLDMVPDFVNKFVGGKQEETVSEKAMETAQEIAVASEEAEKHTEEKPAFHYRNPNNCETDPERPDNNFKCCSFKYGLPQYCKLEYF